MIEKQYLINEIINFKNKFDIHDSEIKEHFDQIDYKMIHDISIDSSFDEVIDDDLRKSTGSYYTPKNVAEFMIKKGLIDYFSINTRLDNDKLVKLFFENINLFNKSDCQQLFNKLQTLKVADLSSGTGVFLINYFNLIISYLIKINKKYTFKKEINFENILMNNIYGFDINATALAITKIRLNNLYLEISTSNKIIDINLFNINSITDDHFRKYIPGDKFDLILGNPPYLGEKGNKKLFTQLKTSTFGKQFYEGKMDLFYFFIYRGINSLKDQGVLTYITTNYFITADGAKTLRQFLYNNGSFIKIYNFNEVNLFSSKIKIHSLIFSYAKNANHKTAIHNISTNDQMNEVLNNTCREDISYSVEKENLFDETGEINLYKRQTHVSLIKKIKNYSQNKVNDFFNVNQGLVSGADKVTKNMLKKKLSDQTIQKYNILPSDDIFIIENSSKKFIEKKYLKKFYKNSDINQFSVNHNTNKNIIYITDETKIDDILLEHLVKYKEVLENRREVRKGTRRWTSLQWPRTKEIFENEKLVAPQRAKKNIFGYTNQPFYGSADIYYISKKVNLFDYNIFVLLGYLNSKIIYFYLLNAGKTKGNILELYATPLKNIPLKKFKRTEQIVHLTKELINGFDQDIFDELNKIFYREFNFNEKEIKIIENTYDGDSSEK